MLFRSQAVSDANSGSPRARLRLPGPHACTASQSRIVYVCVHACSRQTDAYARPNMHQHACIRGVRAHATRRTRHECSLVRCTQTPGHTSLSARERVRNNARWWQRTKASRRGIRLDGNPRRESEREGEVTGGNRGKRRPRGLLLPRIRRASKGGNRQIGGEGERERERSRGFASLAIRHTRSLVRWVTHRELPAAYKLVFAVAVVPLALRARSRAPVSRRR